jgi:pimeloyl-ACP methyl ester carboxylesterase
MDVAKRSLAALEDPFSEDPSVQPAQTPLWREAFCGAEWLALHCSPVYYGVGVPRGHGEPVVIVPGFLASDLSLVELFGWLARIGYRPYFSQIGRNADCPDHMATRLLDTVRRAYFETRQPVRIIGHSLGGLLARSVALDFPEYVGGVICLGSPFRDAVRTHPAVIAAADSLRARVHPGLGRNVKPSCFSGHCTCDFVKNILDPDRFRVAHFAIYSKSDGVVDWQSCVEEDAALNDEVASTHYGMIFHPSAYQVIARRLAEIAPRVHDTRAAAPPQSGRRIPSFETAS